MAGVAHLEVEYLLGTERSVRFGAQAVEDRREGGAHDRFGELAGGVVRARPTPLFARLQHHRALWHEVRGRVAVDDRVEGGVERLHGVGIARRPPQPVRQLSVGAVLQPLGALGGRLVEQGIQIDRGRGTLLLGGPDGDGEAVGRLQAEAHHRLVDRADVFDVQGPVGDALAVEHDELLQHPVDGAVGDQGRVDALVDLPGAALAAPLQEAIPVGVEEGAVSRREPHRAGPGAVVDHAE